MEKEEVDLGIITFYSIIAGLIVGAIVFFSGIVEFFGQSIDWGRFCLVDIVIMIICFFLVFTFLWNDKNSEVKKRNREKEFREKEEEEYAKEMRARGLVEYRGNWGTIEQVNKWREIGIGLDNNFTDYSPYEFEQLIGKLFIRMGYDTQVTQKSKDYGVDVIAKKNNVTIAIQVKKYSHGTLVSNTDIQQTLGAMWKIKAEQAILVTTSRFTVHAKEQAKDAPIELWDKEILHNMIRKYFIENEAMGKI